MSDGTPCRPLVHVDDICQAILCALESPREAVCGEAFNVGTEAQNYTVREIAEIVSKTFPGSQVTYGPSGPDNRSYRVSFAKIRERMPTFKCQWSAERGALQLKTVFQRIQLDEAIFNSAPFTRLSELRHLRRTEQIDPRLLWTPIEKTFPAAASLAEVSV